MYTTIKEKEAYYAKIKEKRKANKNKLILDVVYDLMENTYENQDYIKSLITEALSKRTQKELKQILYGE